MLNEKEKNIIALFLKNLDEYENEEMTLLWHNSNKVVALFDTCFEDENDYDSTDEDAYTDAEEDFKDLVIIDEDELEMEE